MSEVLAFDEIKRCIEERKSFCFNAGAGSGKTYSLVQTVDYILKKYADDLKINNQKIMVITFTNAAADEIVKRVGHTRLLDVSTIHTRMWEIIKSFQTELLLIHVEKMKKMMSNLKIDIEGSAYYQDNVLNENISSKIFKDEYYKYKSLKAPELKARFSKYTASGEISKVGEFKDYVSAAIKYNKLLMATENIDNKKPGYTKVEYDPLNNYDRLHKMRFSHDTLIEYSKCLIEKSNIIKRIIIDKYPFIFVDEFQDTNPSIISLLALIDKSSNNKCIIGYYGDVCQNIYENGVGENIKNYHNELYDIYKKENRRSAKEIVEIANNIRNDQFLQVPLLNIECSCNVFYSTREDVNDFINETINKLPNDEEVHCLVLKNDIVAERTGFGEFYNLIAKTKYYKDQYKQLTVEVLDDDVKKLGRVPLLLFKWLKLYSNINNPNLSICKYIPRKVYDKINTYQLIKLREKMEAVSCDNLLELITNMFKLGKEEDNIKEILEYNIGEIYKLDIEEVKGYLFECLFSQINDEEITEAKNVIESLLKIKFNVMLRWYQYINKNISTRIQFHTFHGVKGLEYKNLIIVLTNSFNHKSDYFHSFFKSYNKETSQEDINFIEKRNLLYVAVTRAKQTMSLLYLDPNFDAIKENFKSIFGEVKEWENIKT